MYYNINNPSLKYSQDRREIKEFSAVPTPENLYRIVSQKDRKIHRSEKDRKTYRDDRDERIQTPYTTDIRSRLTDAFNIAYNAFEKKHNLDNYPFEIVTWYPYKRYSENWDQTKSFYSGDRYWYFETAVDEQQKDIYLKEEFEKALIKAREQANIAKKEKKVSLFSIQEPTLFDKVSGWFKRTFTTTEDQNHALRTYKFTRPKFNWARSYIPTKQQVGTILSKTPTSFKPNDNAEKAMRRLEKTGMGYQ